MELQLDAKSIDRASQYTDSVLEKLEVPEVDKYRCRLFVEESLGIWKKEFGEDKKCIISSGTKFKKAYIRAAVSGERCNPKETTDELYGEMLENSGLLYSLGVPLDYDYANGQNVITITPPKQDRGTLFRVIVAILFALLISVFSHILVPQQCNMIAQSIVAPLFNTMMNLLMTIAGPLIFLSVCSGIYGIGNISVVGRMAGKLVKRFTIMTFIPLILFMILFGWCFPISELTLDGKMGNRISEIYDMILKIVPTDIITPFQTGNALQIIFLACAVGISILLLGHKVSHLTDIIGQIHNVARLLMETIGKIVPFFVFLSILNLLLPNSIRDCSGLIKQILFSILFLCILFLLYYVRIYLKWKLSIGTLLKKLLPTFMIAVTTASSAATFGINVETCEKSLGISKKTVEFGIPIGQVIFMPAGAVAFLVSALCIGEMYSVFITPVWIVTAIIVSGILAIATPPIPGGALSCYTILFMQLGIPTEGIALAISIDMLMDFILTAMNLLYLQCEMLFVANDLRMLDETKLKDKNR